MAEQRLGWSYLPIAGELLRHYDGAKGKRKNAVFYWIYSAAGVTFVLGYVVRDRLEVNPVDGHDDFEFSFLGVGSGLRNCGTRSG